MIIPKKSFVRHFRSDYTVKDYLMFDNDTGELLLREDSSHRWKQINIHSFVDSEIIHDEYIQNKFSLPGALLGGAVLGAIGGAVAGGIGGALLGQKNIPYLSTLIVRVYFKNELPFDFKIITSKTKYHSSDYKRGMKELEQISKLFAIAKRDIR